MDIIQVNDNRIVKVFRYIKARFSGDTHEPVQIGPFGDDSCPPKGIKGVKAPTSTDAIHVVLGYFNRNNKASAGEKRLFSVKEDGTEGFYTYFKNDGSFELGGTADYAVRYNELKKGFDQLVTDFNALVTKYNAHVHTSNGAVTTNTGTTSSADISNSKISQITTP